MWWLVAELPVPLEATDAFHEVPWTCDLVQFWIPQMVWNLIFSYYVEFFALPVPPFAPSSLNRLLMKIEEKIGIEYVICVCWVTRALISLCPRGDLISLFLPECIQN